MKLNELIEAAKNAKKSYGSIADELGTSQSRISEWKAGTRKPTTEQIGMLAEIAGLPVVETIYAIATETDSGFADLWGRIVGKMKAAGVTAVVTTSLLISSMMMPNPGEAKGGGSGEIRTHGGRKTPAVFKTAAFNRSATLPLVEAHILT